jgi:TolB-like protein
MRNASTGPELTTSQRSETRSIRALVGLGVLQVILLLALLALAVRILLKEDSRSKEQPDSTITVEKVLGQLAQLQKKPGQPIDTKPARDNPVGLTFDSLAVLPTRSKIDAIADTEAAKVSPGLTFLLEKNKRLKVIPFEKVKELPEKTDPPKAAKALDVGALLVLELYTKDFVRLNIFLKVELVETKTGLALLAETIDLGEYSGPEWKQKLTQAIGKVVTETEACSANNP